MARPVREHLKPWSQQGGAEEPETNISVPQQEEQRDAARGKVIADYDPEVNYKPEGSDPEIEAINEEEKNFDQECAIMELPQDRTLHLKMMNCKVTERSSGYIKNENLKLCPCGSRIYTCGLDSVLKQPDCSSESKDLTVQKGLEHSLTRILMSSVMLRGNKAARMSIECPTYGSRFQSQPRKT